MVLSDIDVEELARLPRKAPTEDKLSIGDSGANGEELRDNLREVTEPAVIADRAGNIILWYLPKGMSGPNQVRWDPDCTGTFEFFAAGPLLDDVRNSSESFEAEHHSKLKNNTTLEELG